MIIKRFQNGGGFATFTPIIKTAPQHTTSGSNQSESKTQSSILDDKLYAELIKGGLTNDVNALVSQLIELESTSDMPFTNTNTRATSLRLIGKINEIRQNKLLWEGAVSKAEKSGGLDEVAVGTSGEVYTKDDKNKIKAISLQEYSENKDSIKLLSVAELMNERNHNAQLTGQNNIFNVANNAIGLKQITTHIKDLINAFGTESVSSDKTYSKEQILTELGKYAGKKPTAEELVGVQKLMDVASTPGDIYRVKTEQSSERNQLMKGAKYIWETLGEPAQKKLAATAVLSGKKNPVEFIIDMISVNTDEKTSTAITPEKLPETEETNASKKTADITPFELFHNGKLGKQIIPWNDPSSGKTFNLTATGVSRLMSMDGKPLGGTTLQSVLNSENGAVVNTQKVFFGDKKVSPNDLNALVYDGGLAMRVYAPVSSDGGVDYYKLEALKKIEEQVAANKNLTTEQINDMYNEAGFSYVKVDNQKQYILNDRFKPFLMFTAYGTDEMNSTDNNAKIQKLFGEEEDQISGYLDKIWSDAKVEKPTGSLWTNYYKGMVAIPYIEDSSIYTGAIAKNIKDRTSTLTDVRLNKERNNGTVINASSNSLW